MILIRKEVITVIKIRKEIQISGKFNADYVESCLWLPTTQGNIEAVINIDLHPEEQFIFLKEKEDLK